MRVPQRLDYAVRVLTALADRPPAEPAVAGELAETLRLPRRFVEQQLTALAKAGVLNARRGAGGGFAFARPPERVSVADVVRALEGAVLDVPHTTDSAVTEMWSIAAAALEDHLESVTVRQLADRQAALDFGRGAMYHI